MSVWVYTVKSHPTENKSGTVTIPTKVTVTNAHHMMQRENYFIEIVEHFISSVEHEHTAGSSFSSQPSTVLTLATSKRSCMLSEDRKPALPSTKHGPQRVT